MLRRGVCPGGNAGVTIVGPFALGVQGLRVLPCRREVVADSPAQGRKLLRRAPGRFARDQQPSLGPFQIRASREIIDRQSERFCVVTRMICRRRAIDIGYEKQRARNNDGQDHNSICNLVALALTSLHRCLSHGQRGATGGRERLYSATPIARAPAWQ